MKNGILILITLCLSLFGLSQNSYHLVGKVLNTDNEPVKDAKVFLSTNNKLVKRTSTQGEFHYKISKQAKGEIVFNHIGYQQQALPLSKKLFKTAQNDTIYLTIKLADLELREVVIGGKQKPIVVYGSQQNSIHDFIFIDDNLLLLSYDKSIEKDPLLKLVSQNQELIAEYTAPKEAKSLFTDYENKHYLICEHHVYIITVFQKEIRLRETDKQTFDDFTSKIIDTLNQQYLYSNFSNAYPAFDFFHQSMYKKEAVNFHHIEDEFMMDLYRSEYKYASTKDKVWALRQEINTGIDKEIWIGARDFTGSLYYKTLYAPLILFEDTIRIFDHYKDLMFVYDTSYNLLDSLPINYHKSKEDKKNWEQPLVPDVQFKKLYSLYLAGGYHYLKDINLHTGKTETAFQLYYKYAENVKVKEGYVYYIYRPYESLQRKYLYREKIEKI